MLKTKTQFNVNTTTPAAPEHRLAQEVEDIRGLVIRTRGRLRRSRMLAGIAWTAGLVLSSLTLFALVDLLSPLEVWARIAAATILALVGLGVLAVGVFWQALRPIPLGGIAFLIESKRQNMHNRLVTALDLPRLMAEGRVDSPAFAMRLLEQTRERLVGFHPGQVVNPALLRRGAVVLAIALIAASVVVGVFRGRVATAALRIMLPTARIAPASAIRLLTSPGNVSVLQGDPLPIRATLQSGSTNELSVRVKTGDGAWTTYPMSRDEQGTFAFVLSAVNDSGRYQVTGPGTWTDEYTITMLRRPVIEQVAATVHLPEYMGMPQPRPVDTTGGQVSAPINSTLEMLATVSGKPSKGRLLLLKATTTETPRTNIVETVWFDDDLPGDAQAIGTWRWTADHFYSGTRAHTFAWSRKPYGFTTKLSRLTVPPKAMPFVYLWLDPKDSPARMLVWLAAQGKVMTLAWGAAPAAGQAAATLALPVKPAITVEMGALPAPGRWIRLELPLQNMPGWSASAATILEGMGLASNGGRVYFDRAGYFETVQDTARSTQYDTIAEYPAQKQTDGKWLAKAPIDVDGFVALEFFNERHDPSPPMKPLAVLATIDQPPTILIEKPAKNLTLATVEAVPLLVRAFDDYGVAEIGIQYAPTQDKFAQTTPLATYADPQPSRLLVSSIDVKTLKLAPGGEVYYRLVTKDRKGQIATSNAFRIGLAASNAPPSTPMEKDLPSLNPMLDGLAKLLAGTSKISDAALKLLSDLPVGLPTTTGPAAVRPVKLLNPDGTEMSAQQLEAWLKKKYQSLTPDQVKELTAANQAASAQQAQLQNLAQQLDAAAKLSEQSALTLPLESAAMRDMANQLRDMAAQMPKDQPLGPEVLERLRHLAELDPKQQEELQELQRQVQALLAAQQERQQNPGDAQQALASLMAQMQANRNVSQLEQLGLNLQQQQQELESARQQLAALQQMAQSSDNKTMDKVSQDQTKLDAQTLEAIRQAEELLREQQAGQAMEQNQGPPDPWMPPGPRDTFVPDEKDTPEKDPKAAAAKDAAKAALEALKEQKARQEQEKKNWWDEPAPAPLLGRTSEEDARHRRDDRPVEPGKAQPLAFTPRQMLQQHQEELQQYVQQTSKDLGAAQQQVNQTAQRMNQLLEQMRQQPLPGEAAQQQAAELQQLMASPQMRGMTAAAQRAAAARLLREMAANQKPTPPGQNVAIGLLQGQATPGQIVTVDLSGIDLQGLNPAGLYRLPPRVREPLIQGLHERGPEGYQDLIDAYYRRLGTADK